MNQELQDRGIPWSNCISFAADNAAVMSGQHKGVIAFVKQANEDVYFLGCPCHLIHLAAEKGASILPVSVEDLLINIFYYLDKSSKRQKELKEFQVLHDVATRKILKHVSTRWLSLGVCLDRILSQWMPLQHFFKEESREIRRTNALLERNFVEDAPKDHSHAKSASASSSSVMKKKSAGKTVIPSKPDSGLAFLFQKEKTDKVESKKNPDSETNITVRKFATKAMPPSKSDSQREASENVKSKKTTAGHLKNSKDTSKLTADDKKNPSANSKSRKPLKESANKVMPASKSDHKLDNHSQRVKSNGKDTSQLTSGSHDKKKNPSQKSSSVSRKPTAGERRAERIYENLRSNNFKLYCLFLKHVLPLFDHANQLLQNEKPCVHILHGVLDSLLQKNLTSFVKPDVIVNATTSTSVHYKSRDNQKNDENLSIGAEAREFIQDHPGLDLVTFYQSVRFYFGKVCDYMCKSFPFGDEVLLHAAVADVPRRHEMDFCSLSFFVKRFRGISDQLHPGTLDELEREFLEYQVEKLDAEVLEADRADTAWALIGKVIDPVTGKKKFALLSKVMLAILVIFHSNTDCERIFSFVTKAKTKFRPNMTTPTLSALVTHKVAMLSRGEKAWSAELGKQILKDAKNATYSMLNK